MRRLNRAFTLTELLIVLAIIAVLAGVLFPVFRSARESAYRTACLMNMRQAQQAFSIYYSDYDDRFVPVSHQPAGVPNSRNDRTWVQLTLPYLKSFSIFRCPSDYSERGSADATFDQDLVPGDTLSQYYTASQHVNLGYNYIYMSPVVRNPQGAYRADTRSVSAVNSPSSSIILVDSLWARTADGTPIGGGSWLVTPPCRWYQDGPRRRDSFNIIGNEQISPMGNGDGWEADPKSPLIYGGAWPWHAGRMNVVRVDGSAKSLTPVQLAAGCDVRENWNGIIRNREQYVWDTE